MGLVSEPRVSQGLTLTTRYPVQNTPPDVKHRGVVIDMKKGDLIGLFSKNKENRVQELH